MAQLPRKVRLYPGVYCDMKLGNGFTVDMSLDIRWYGYISLYLIAIYSLIFRREEGVR